MVRAEVGVRGTGEGSALSACSRRRIARRERTDVLVVAANLLHRPGCRTFFRSDRLRRYGLEFCNGTRQPVEAHVGEIANGNIEPSCRDHPIFTRIADPLALLILGQRCHLRPEARIVAPPGRNFEGVATLTPARAERRRDGAGLTSATFPRAGHQ